MGSTPSCLRPCVLLLIGAATCQFEPRGQSTVDANRDSDGGSVRASLDVRPAPGEPPADGPEPAGSGCGTICPTDGPPVPTPPSPDDGPQATPPSSDGPPAPIAACGNGRVDPGETCDPPGECPRSCPEITCTIQRLVGSPDTCNVRCEEQKISACVGGDKCCPRNVNPSCTALNDAECSAVCDNGAVEAGETCDPRATCQARADACRDDRDTLRTVSGDVNACTTACTERKRPCQSGDGQCPAGCTASTDPDCAGCGNGRLEAGETCDPPSECRRRSDACRDDAQTLRSGSGDVNRCTFRCMERNRPCQSGDGECPSGCSPGADNDCPGCGNRRVEPGETCDGNCPTNCPQQNCRRRRLQGGGTCRAECVDDGEVTCSGCNSCRGNSCQPDNSRCASGQVCESGTCRSTCQEGERQCGRNDECTRGISLCPSGCRQAHRPGGTKCGGPARCIDTAAAVLAGSCSDDGFCIDNVPVNCSLSEICVRDKCEPCGRVGQPCCDDSRAGTPFLCEPSTRCFPDIDPPTCMQR